MSDRFAFEWAEAFENSDLPAGTIAILRVLQTFLNNKTGFGYPTIAQLCAKSKRSKTTVIYHLKYAEKDGWLESWLGKKSNGQNWKNKTYQAIIPNKGGANIEPPIAKDGSFIIKGGSVINEKVVQKVATNSIYTSYINSNTTSIYDLNDNEKVLAKKQANESYEKRKQASVAAALEAARKEKREMIKSS